LGVLGPIIGNDERSGKYVESVLWSVWTSGDLGVLWWMAFDSDTNETPYDWEATERELGFMDINRNPKSVVLAMCNFKQSIKSLPFVYHQLPKRKADAVCILSYCQESWTVAYSTYVMAKQSGFDIRFNAPEDSLPESDFYMLPSIKGVNSISKNKWNELLKKIKDGACLYISFGNVFISSFSQITGLEIIEREVRTEVYQISYEDTKLTIPAVKDGNEDPYRFILKNCGAETMLEEEDGNPFLVKNKYGEGTIYTLFASIEYFSSYKQGVFDDDSNDLSCLYRLIFKEAIQKKLVIKDKKLKNIAVSEHAIDENTIVLVIINHGNSRVRDSFKLNERIKDITALRGSVDKDSYHRLQFNLLPNDAAVVEIKI